MPDIPPDMAPLWSLFLACDSQLRAGLGGAYALDWMAVRGMAIDMGIKRNKLFYRALKVFEYAMITAMNKKQPIGD